MAVNGMKPRSARGWKPEKQPLTVRPLDIPDSPAFQDRAAERASLETSLVSGEAWDVVRDSTLPEMYVDDHYREIRQSMENVALAGKRVGAVNVAHDLERRGLLEQIGGPEFLQAMVEQIPDVWNCEGHCSKIAECWRRRRANLTAVEMVEKSADPMSDITAVEQALGIGDSFSAGKLFPVVTAKELCDSEHDLEYLIDGMLVRGQNCILAGPKKTLKTNLAIALALRLAVGGYLFRGERWTRYHVPKPVRVAIMSGESGAATIKETAMREARSMGWGLDQIDGLLFCFSIPNLSSPEHLQALRQFVKENKIEVLFLDPAYLMLPVGDAAGNLFIVGGLLMELNKLSQETGLTVVLLHHLRKQIIDPSKPPELEDIAWAGFQEFARQWILIGRRTPYNPERGGHHELWMNLGGSAGHSGLIGLDIDEGTRQDEGGRIWQVNAITAEEARYRAAEEAEERKQGKKDRQFDATRASNREKVLAVLQKYPEGETKNRLAVDSRLNWKNLAVALEELQDEGTVEACEFSRDGETGGRKCKGFRISPTVRQTESDTLSVGEGSSPTDNPPSIRGGCRSRTELPLGGYEIDLGELSDSTGDRCANGEPASGRDF